MISRKAALFSSRGLFGIALPIRQYMRRGSPPGLLAFDGELAVGWCQLTPGGKLRGWIAPGGLKRVDDAQIWSLSCFDVRKGYRRKGGQGGG
jgi:hypothetical protein